MNSFTKAIIVGIIALLSIGGLVLWKVSGKPRRVLVAANGHSLTLPFSLRSVLAVAALMRGGGVEPACWFNRFPG